MPTSPNLPSIAGSANRKEILRRLIHLAEFNGFEFRRWFHGHVQPVWPGAEQAIPLLSQQGRHYTLLFSHGFARFFWRDGSQISFAVPNSTYHRVNGQGKVLEVTRKPFTRRTAKPDVWRYHLTQMAAAEDPIHYISRFLPHQQEIRAIGNGTDDATPPA